MLSTTDNEFQAYSMSSQWYPDGLCIENGYYTDTKRAKHSHVLFNCSYTLGSTLGSFLQ